MPSRQDICGSTWLSTPTDSIADTIPTNGLQSALSQTTVHDTGSQVGRHEATKNQSQSGQPSYTDTVTLTDDASLLQSALSKVNELPVIDTQRVESIRNALETNTYKFNFDNIASQLYSKESMFNNA